MAHARFLRTCYAVCATLGVVGLTSAAGNARDPRPHVDIYYGVRHVNPQPANEPRPDERRAVDAPVLARDMPTPISRMQGESVITWADGSHAEPATPLVMFHRLAARTLTSPSVRTVAHAVPDHDRANVEPSEVAAEDSYPPRRLPAGVNRSRADGPASASDTPRPEREPRPIVVVIRDAHATTAAAPVVNVGSVAAVAAGFLAATVAALLALLWWARTRPVPTPDPVVELVPAAVAPESLPVATPDATSTGVKLLGQYDAGPLPESAEKFELGPTYQDDRVAEKRHVAANDQAALQMLLGENLALLAELGPAAPADAHVPPADRPDAAPALV